MNGGRLERVWDVGPDLWLWRVGHPDWQPSDDWDPVVTTTVVRSRGEVIVIDPLAPEATANGVWDRLEAEPPTQLVVLKPDHARHVDWFVQRFGVPAWGPPLVDPDDVPTTRLIPLYPGLEMPGGLFAWHTGRFSPETPLWLPDQKALVFADALTERGGRLRIWSTPWDEAGPRRVLEQLGRLPFDHVIISHGSPVHDRAAYAAALKRDPWQSPALEAWAKQIQTLRQALHLEPWPKE